MGNICSIFHVRFKHLVTAVNSTRKAQLIDYILLSWQTSTYRLRNSNLKWFMKPYSEIIAETGIPKSTLERYIKELNEDGFIERRQALYSRTKENGEFEVKKGNYIYITDKLLNLLKPSDDLSLPSIKNTSQTATTSKQIHHKPVNPKPKTEVICSILNKNEGIGSLKMRGSYISDHYKTYLNNVIKKKNNSFVDKTKYHRQKEQLESIQQFLYTEIKEELPDEVKTLLTGTFFNLTFTHQKLFSVPKQIIAEYLYALLNKEFFMPEVNCIEHRNNILSKLIRSNRWCTPKGFYKYFYLGDGFKAKHELREFTWEQTKQTEISQKTEPLLSEQKDEKLHQLEVEMVQKVSLLEQLKADLYQQSSEEMILKMRERIKVLHSDLESLWQRQWMREQELEMNKPLTIAGQCA